MKTPVHLGAWFLEKPKRVTGLGCASLVIKMVAERIY